MNHSVWHYVSAEAHQALGDHPEKLFVSAVQIKQNHSRRVLKAGGLYLKTDKRPFHSFGREVKIARQLNEAGIPTAEILAWGKFDGQHAMISREVPDSIAFDLYLHTYAPSYDTLNALTELVRKWLNSPFLHRDFHAGNLLCIPEENRFVLVDLHAVYRKLFRRIRPDYEAARVLLAPRRWLREKEMQTMLANAGIPDPAAFYNYALQKEARILLGEWRKRRTQILHGYPKFTRVDNDRLLAVNSPAVSRPERLNNGKNCFLAHILLNIAAIPHRPVPELDLLTGEALLAPRPSAMLPPPQALCDEMIARLNLYGIRSKRQDWSMMPRETLPVLIDLSSAVEAIERWEKVGV